MNVDIENSSLMSNYKDCRPPGEFSLFSNKSLAEKTAGKKKAVNDHNSLSINKTI
jgi:hypothetical protein